MAYEKQIWENLPSTNTPVSAERLNHMEVGIYEASAGTSIEVHNDYNNSTTEPYSANYVNKLSNYSTEETVCGRWIDGKPIYRKVIDTTYSGEINTNIQNLDTMIKMNILAKQTSVNAWRNLPWLYATNSTYGDPSWAGGFYFISASSTIKFQLGSSLDDISKLIIILEYTKTTD